MRFLRVKELPSLCTVHPPASSAAKVAIEQGGFWACARSPRGAKITVGQKRWALLAVADRKGTEPMPDKALDAVEWELVRADIAVEKARLKANVDWAKWEEFQAQTDARLATYNAPLDWRARERFALWWDRTPELSGLMGAPRRRRRLGWPLR
jgi:hypothetical protein